MTVFALVAAMALASPIFVEAYTEQPIIGILSQGLSRSMRRVEQLAPYDSYIAASYVKLYEAAGARVVPILTNQKLSYYEDLLDSINGVVFPGGSAGITSSSTYGSAGRTIYSLLLQKADQGVRIPLQATCLGFEMLLRIAAGDQDPLTRCSASGKADPLIPGPDWSDAWFFRDATEDVMWTLRETKATSNFHKYCVTPETFHSLNLSAAFHLVSTSLDSKGLEYVSSVSHRTLPWIGFQWHPEKNAFEWRSQSIPHDRASIVAASYTADVFVEEARKNDQGFNDDELEKLHLIYRYSNRLINTDALYKSSFHQCYMFNDEDFAQAIDEDVLPPPRIVDVDGIEDVDAIEA